MNWKSKLLVWLRLWHEERSVTLTSDSATSNVVSRIGTWTIIELFSFIFLLASYAWMFIGIYWDHSGAECSWFQRSGAVVVLSAASSEFFVVDTVKTRAHVADFVKITNHYERLRKVFYYFGFFSIALGTLVWAYGDLFV